MLYLPDSMDLESTKFIENKLQKNIELDVPKLRLFTNLNVKKRN